MDFGDRELKLLEMHHACSSGTHIGGSTEIDTSSPGLLHFRHEKQYVTSLTVPSSGY